jgi:hypothetical protein
VERLEVCPRVLVASLASRTSRASSPCKPCSGGRVS